MPEPLMARSEHQLRLRHRLDARLDQIRTRARRAMTARQTQQEREQQQAGVAAGNPHLVTTAMAHRVFFLVMLAALPTAYIVDVILLGPVAEFLAGEGFPEDAFIVRWAPFIVPAAIISLEMVLGGYRLAAHREYLAGDGRREVYTLLTLFATAFAMLIPASGVALYLHEETEIPEALTGRLVVFLPIALTVALSLTCHLCILLGARRMHEAKAWLAFEVRRWSLRQQAQAARQTFARESTTAADLFVPYLRDLEEHNEAYQPRLAAGPFDRDTRAVLNEVYGYEVIQTAPGAPITAAPRAASAGDGGAPPTGGHAAGPTPGAPDWRAFQARQQYHDESEVRP